MAEEVAVEAVRIVAVGITAVCGRGARSGEDGWWDRSRSQCW